MRPRSDSLLTKEDALSAGVGMICGLLAFSRDLSEFAGGAIVLSLLLVALCSEDKDQRTEKEKNADPTSITWARAIVSWSLLWTALASLEMTTTRWSTPLSLVYALYFFTRAPFWGVPGALSLLGVLFCHLSVRQFALWFPNDGVLIALGLHALCWTINLRLRPRTLALNPKAILLDAPLWTVRDALFGPALTPRSH